MRRHLWLLILVIAVIAVLPAFAGGDHGKCKYSTQDCLDHMAIKMKSSGWVGVELDTEVAEGYAVTKVFPGSPAEAAGIQAGDVLVALTTSGRSASVLNAVHVAHACGMTVVGFTGAAGRRFAAQCDHALIAPGTATPRIQEAHIALGHTLCELVERAIFARPARERRGGRRAARRSGAKAT